MSRTPLVIAVGVLILVGACGGAEPDVEFGANATDSLPTLVLAPDEDAPQGVAAAFAESDYVVVARIADVVDGHRFYGETEEDPDTLIYEDVLLELDVTETLKGEPPSPLRLRWPAFANAAADSDAREAQLVVGGIPFDALDDSAAVFFIKEYDEPFGTSPIALSAAVLQVDGENRVVGASTALGEHDGQPLAEVLAGVG